MPIYEYHCAPCRTTFNFLVRNPGTHRKPRCPKCKRSGMQRRFSRFAMSRQSKTVDAAPADDAAPENMPDMPDLSGIDENDPKAMARFMRQMAKETGEDLGPEFDEVCARLEAGEDPEKIEEKMGDAFGPEAGETHDDTLYDA